jgi:hypothetical protein
MVNQVCWILLHTLLRPEKRLMSTMTTAISNRTWINPPMEVLVTMPSNHKTSSTTAIVYSITFLPLRSAAAGGAKSHQPTATGQLVIPSEFNGHIIDHTDYASMSLTTVTVQLAVAINEMGVSPMLSSLWPPAGPRPGTVRCHSVHTGFTPIPPGSEIARLGLSAGKARTVIVNNQDCTL